MIRTGLIIQGEELPARAGRVFDVLSPATEQVIGQAARADPADVDRAVDAAQAGFRTWQALDPRQREAALLAAAQNIEQQGEDRLLDLLIDESGSTISKARFEIRYTVDLLRTAAGESRRLFGETFPNDRCDRVSMVFREPLGVVAIIAPYNAPLALTAKMAAFPLAAGNAVVIKPSEETPMVAVEFCRLLNESGFPAGVINAITGFGAECGAPLVSHRHVDGIALTGSTATGIQVGAAAMQRMRPVQLELGGKSALLVLADADPEESARIAADGVFAHAGQICMANSRIVVERPVLKPFLDALKSTCESLSLGDLRDPNTAYGPLINRAALEKVQDHLRQALAQGATLLTGGEVASGLTYRPTVVLEPPASAAIWREETFGPVASVVAANDLDHGIELANDSEFGLSAAILTRDVKKAFRAAREIRAGSVHIGMHAFQSNAIAPIGGYGMSGLGRSGGHYSVEEFTQLKWVSVELGA